MKNDASEFLDRLRELGFFEMHSLLGDGNVRGWDWEKMAPQLHGSLLDAWRFLLLGQVLPRRQTLDALGAPGLRFLEELGLCRRTGPDVSLETTSLISYRNRPFFIDRNPIAGARFTEENKALVSLLPREAEGECLHLYPSTGAEILQLIALPNLRINLPKSASQNAILMANLALHASDRNYRFVPLSRGQSEEHFDLIVANPPSYFEPQGLKLPRHITGGTDGRKCVREALEIGAKTLTEKGELLMNCVFFSGGDSAAMETELRALFETRDLDYCAVVCSKLLMEPGVPVFNQIVSCLTLSNKLPAEAVVEKLLGHLKRKNFGAAYLVKGRFFRRQNPSRREITNYSDLYYGTWTF